MNKTKIWLTVILFSMTASVLSEEMGLEYLFLKDVKEVSIAAKTKENIIEASGTVYVFTQNDFKRFGWRTVFEVLEAIPNVDVINNYRYADGGQRGFAFDLSQTILLLDGKEISKYEDGRSHMIYSIPIHNVNRIEILQGPNSTLYGSHALEGVINVITETSDDSQDDSKVSFEFLKGDVSTEQASFSAFNGTSDSFIGVSGQYFTTDRDWDELADFYTNPQNINTWWRPILDTRKENFTFFEETFNVQLHAKLKNFYAGSYHYQIENQGFLGTAFPGAGFGKFKTDLIYLGYRFDKNENFYGFIEAQKVRQIKNIKHIAVLPSQATMNIDLLRAYNITFNTHEKWDIDVWKLMGQMDYLVSNHHIILGLDLKTQDNFSARPINTMNAMESDRDDWPNTESDKISIFIQDQMSFINNHLKLTLGARYNQEDFTEDKVSPRASCVYSFNEDHALKVSYSEGFRALTYSQYGQLKSGEEAKPSEMDMIEVNYSMKYENDDLQIMNILAWYDMKNSNLLKRQTSFDLTRNITEVSWYNEGENKVSGIEDLIKFTYKHFTGFFGFRFIDPEETVSLFGEKYIASIPEHKIKCGLSYQFNSWFNAAVFIDHWGEIKYENQSTHVSAFPITTPQLITQDPFTIVDLNLNFGEFTISDSIPCQFSIFVGNLFDESYVHALRDWIGSGTIQPPRHYNIKFSAKL